jgi:hypothetical protein
MGTLAVAQLSVSPSSPQGIAVLGRLLVGVFFCILAAGLAVAPRQAAAQASKPIYERVTEPALKAGMDFPEPKGPVVLTVGGRIASDRPIRFDLPTLEALGLVRFTTLTSWTVDPSVFEGVLLSALLDAVGADPAATTLRLIALNEFESLIPAADARTWPVMLALKRDGEYMPRRDRGPIWVIYPQHAFPELGHRDFLSRWVWQLKSIMVE